MFGWPTHMWRWHAEGLRNRGSEYYRRHIEGAHVLAQCARITGQGFCCLSFVVCCLMCVDNHNFLSFKVHWALLACLRWSLGTLGLPWVRLDGHWVSICHCWGSIGAPLGRYWAPFVAFGVPLGRLWASLGLTLRSLCDQFGLIFSFFVSVRTFVFVCVFLLRTTHHEASQLWVGPNICRSKWRALTKTHFSPKRNIAFVCIFASLKLFFVVFAILLKETTRHEAPQLWVGPNICRSKWTILKNTFPPKTRHRFRMHFCGSTATSQIFVYQIFVTKPQCLRYQTLPTKSILK